MKRNGFTIVEVLIVLLIIVIVLVSVRGCTNKASEERARDLLLSQGMTDVTMTGHRFFGCGEGDVFRNGFTAKSPTGIPVSGVVCGGLMKGQTVRFD